MGKITDCIYPDWNGGLIYGKHHFDKEGYCVICGETIEQATIIDYGKDEGNIHGTEKTVS